MKAFAPDSLKPRFVPQVQLSSPDIGRPSRTIVDGRIVSVSVSGLAKFNEAEEGCQLRWHMKEVRGYREPKKAATDTGDVIHEQLDHYLSHNQDVLGKIARTGIDFLPLPGPKLRVEWGLNRQPHPPKKDGKKVNYFPHEQSLLYAAGIPLIGFIDLENASGAHVVEENGVWIEKHEPDVIELIDHKSSSDPSKWAKPANMLVETTQMNGYGKFLVDLPEYEHLKAVRLSQVYYPTRGGSAIKRSALVTVAFLRSRWQNAVEPVAERMKSVASERDERKVPGNLAACNAFGGCPHQRYCYKFKETKPVDRLKMQLEKQQKFTPTPEVQVSQILLNKVRGLPAPANGAVPGAAVGLTAREAVNGAGYKFSTGAVGMFIGATEMNGQVVYSFIQVGPDGKTGGTPFPVAPTEPVEMVIPPPQQATPPAPPAPPAGPPAPPAPPAVAGGNTPWIPTTAAPPIAATAGIPTTPAGSIRRLNVPGTTEAAATSAPPEPPKLGRGKKAEAPAAAPAFAPRTRAQVEEAIKTSHEIFTGLYGGDASPEQACAIAELLLG